MTEDRKREIEFLERASTMVSPGNYEAQEVIADSVDALRAMDRVEELEKENEILKLENESLRNGTGIVYCKDCENSFKDGEDRHCSDYDYPIVQDYDYCSPNIRSQKRPM